jgi:hypothetical protein
MSTTFGVLKQYIDHNKIVDEDGDLLWYISEDAFEPVFFRSMRNSRWLNVLGKHSDDNIRVYALDNTNQGIFTIKDCKELLEKQTKQL